MLTVHHLQVSQSERIPWLCEELGIPYELKVYQRAPVLAPADLKALTPMATSPVITDGDLTLSESGAIVEYIIHIYGSGRLALPPTHPAYASYLYWLHFANSTLQPAMSTLFLAAITDHGPSTPMYGTAASKLHKVLGHLESRLAEPGATWLAGEEFTAADIMSVWSLAGMRMFAPISLAPWPRILAYLERVGARPAYQTAMRKGDPEREACLGAEPPKVFAGFGKKYECKL